MLGSKNQQMTPEDSLSGKMAACKSNFPLQEKLYVMSLVLSKFSCL